MATIPAKRLFLPRFRTALAAAALLSAAAAASGMEDDSVAINCQVVSGGEKLPAASGGAAALCAAIGRAMAAEAPGLAARVEIRLLRSTMLEAVAMLPDGRRLASVGFSVSDAPLSAVSFDHLATDLARLVAATIKDEEVKRG